MATAWEMPLRFGTRVAWVAQSRAKGRHSRLAEAYKSDAALFPALDEEEIDLVICVCLYKLLPTLKEEYAGILWRTDLIGEACTALGAVLGDAPACADPGAVRCCADASIAGPPADQ